MRTIEHYDPSLFLRDVVHPVKRCSTSTDTDPDGLTASDGLGDPSAMAGSDALLPWSGEMFPMESCASQPLGFGGVSRKPGQGSQLGHLANSNLTLPEI